MVIFDPNTDDIWTEVTYIARIVSHFDVFVAFQRDDLDDFGTCHGCKFARTAARTPLPHKYEKCHDLLYIHPFITSMASVTTCCT